ncbi:MAG: sulfotransferase domain-containing protein [Microthrixaceae bacterium]
MERYRSIVYDSNRWEGFELRPGDIIVSTPPKCGTTWMQMILALLIFGEPPFPRPLSELSPWLDMQNRARKDVVADLEAQAHRRFIKTHTPLDGLPLDSSVTYICVGRDPRDVALSMDNHMDNLNIPSFLAAREAAAAIDGVELEELIPPPPRLDDLRDRFWAWVDNDTPPNRSGSSLLRTLRHVETFVRAPAGVDIVLMRYEDLQRDRGGEMRRLAERLDVPVAEHAWSALVAAAGFEQMRSNAATVAPQGHESQWKDNERFFNRGTSGQWRALLDDADLDRYRARARAIGPDDVVDWVHDDL